MVCDAPSHDARLKTSRGAGSVYFIDFEYARCNHAAYDIGNHFNEYAGMHSYASLPRSHVTGVDTVDYTRYPSRHHQLSFLRHYLAAKHG